MWHSKWLIARPAPARGFATASARPVRMRSEVLSFDASAGFTCTHVVELGVLSDADLAGAVSVSPASLQRATCGVQRGARHCNTSRALRAFACWGRVRCTRCTLYAAT
jgi:hypothetical protein